MAVTALTSTSGAPASARQTLTVSKATQKQGQARPQTQVRHGRWRCVLIENAVDILLVEDNPNDVILTLHVLTRNNQSPRVHVVRDGVEALEYFFGAGGAEDQRDISPGPKVVLLDLKLPKVDGLEVLRRLKSDPRTRTIPVVVLTSSREERDIVESYQLGVNSFITKPVAFEKFSQAVQQVSLYWLLLNQRPRL